MHGLVAALVSNFDGNCARWDSAEPREQPDERSVRGIFDRGGADADKESTSANTRHCIQTAAGNNPQ